MEKSHEQAEGTSVDPAIIRANLGLLEHQLGSYLSGESIGGNARLEEIDGIIYMRSAANCEVDGQTGRIIRLSNDPSTDLPKITFRILHGSSPAATEIVDIFFGYERSVTDPRITPTAKRAIQETALEWNKTHALERKFSADHTGSLVAKIEQLWRLGFRETDISERINRSTILVRSALEHLGLGEKK